jgi:hypothetical protein
MIIIAYLVTKIGYVFLLFKHGSLDLGEGLLKITEKLLGLEFNV